MGAATCQSSVMTIRAIIARLFPIGPRDRGRRDWSTGSRAGRAVPRGLETLLLAVAVDVTAHAPAHVERRELKDAVHFLDLAVARLARDAGVDMARVRKVDVLGNFVNPHPGDWLGV